MKIQIMGDTPHQIGLNTAKNNTLNGKNHKCNDEPVKTIHGSNSLKMGLFANKACAIFPSP